MHELLVQLESRCEIDYAQLVFGKKLGEGAFGEVYRAHLWGMDVAVKKIKIENHLFPITELTNEIALLKTLRHPNCVLFLGFTRPPNFCIITEYMPRGCLYDLLHNPLVRLSGQHMLKVALSVARGMNYLHTQTPSIVHRDLKSHNILVDDNWTIKVGDYGLSSFKRRLHSQIYCGTAQWQAPEATEGTYGMAADVYSYGVLLWELVTRKTPFEGTEMHEVMRLVRDKNRPPIPNHCSPHFRELIEICWSHTPSDRPTFRQITDRLSQFELYSTDTFKSEVVPHAEVFRETDVEKARTFFKIGSDAIKTASPPNILLARAWASFFHYRMRKEGLDILSNRLLPLMKKVAVGAISLYDDYGKSLVISIYDSQENLMKMDDFIVEDPSFAVDLVSKSCTPLIRENLEITPYSLSVEAGDTLTSLVLTMYVRDSAFLDLQNLFQHYVFPELIDMGDWKGSLAMQNHSSGELRLVMLFGSQDRIVHLEESGFVQQLVSNLSSFLRSIPTVQHYHVQHSFFCPSLTAASFADEIDQDVKIAALLNQSFSSKGSARTDPQKRLSRNSLRKSQTSPFPIAPVPHLVNTPTGGPNNNNIINNNSAHATKKDVPNMVRQSTTPTFAVVNSAPSTTVVPPKDANNNNNCIFRRRSAVAPIAPHSASIIGSPDRLSVPAQGSAKSGKSPGKSRPKSSLTPSASPNVSPMPIKLTQSQSAPTIKHSLTAPSLTPPLPSHPSSFPTEITPGNDDIDDDWQMMANQETKIRTYEVRDTGGSLLVIGEDMVLQELFQLDENERVVKAYNCWYRSALNAGRIYVSPSYICFASTFRLPLPFHKTTRLVIPIRDIVSLNKTRYLLLPGSGHSLEILTSGREVYVFRGIMYRDDLVNVISSQAKLMHPSHSIHVLNNGEPDGLSSPPPPISPPRTWRIGSTIRLPAW
eukprot:TRINITY_DN4290_c0_g2_i1.p1 TRINITY_DN4290_c0_g2~~TRINITY_DN4290_c0_g2_i1.p1  ORF type:complete len:1044 (-),score=175.75 TRINITY_DN4290_c0_g2_i1:118-2904(-)